MPASDKDAWVEVEYRFIRNIPRNVNDEAETARNLEGIISKESQLSILSIVDDVQTEMERIEKENELPEYDYQIKEEQGINPPPFEDNPLE